METLRWKIVYPKYKKGEAVAKKVKVDSTFSKPGNTTISADTLYILLHAFITTVYADTCLLYTSPSPRDRQKSRMPSSA